MITLGCWALALRDSWVLREGFCFISFKSSAFLFLMASTGDIP